MRVHIICQRWKQDRVLSRFTRYLVDRWGWTAGRRPDHKADLNYWLAYLEWEHFQGFERTPTVAFMTHKEDRISEPEKYQLYYDAAREADLRVCMNEASRQELESLYGLALRFPLPLELGHFPLKSRSAGDRPVVGFSGKAYRSGRTGADLAERLVEDFRDRCKFTASGKKWPCPTRWYSWNDMPRFFQSLDIYVSTALVEGGPMPTLEALATGVPVVVGAGVGIHDELPATKGIYKYAKGDYEDLRRAFELALAEYQQVDRGSLRRATSPHTVESWCVATHEAFQQFLADSS
jgi:glycosyltransferase involved in cell wall biosynthesis